MLIRNLEYFKITCNTNSEKVFILQRIHKGVRKEKPHGKGNAHRLELFQNLEDDIRATDNKEELLM